MAQYTITKSCGHDEVVQIFGTNSHGEHKRKAQRLAGQPCGACQRAARQQVAARAAEVAEQAGLPALTGTENQLPWAESIRLDGLTELVDTAQRQAERARRAGWSDEQANAYAEALEAAWRQAALRRTDAGWWIEHRGRIADAAAKELTGDDRAAFRDVVQAIRPSERSG